MFCSLHVYVNGMWRNLRDKNCSVCWSCDVRREMLRVENFGRNTKYSLKRGGAQLGGEVGSVSLRSALHK